MSKCKYKKEFAQELIDYFKKFLEMRDNPPQIVYQIDKGRAVNVLVSGKGKALPRGYPTLTKFAIRKGVHLNTLENWADKHEEFAEAMEFAREIRNDILDERALSGQVDGRVAMRIRELDQRAQERRENGEGNGGHNTLKIERADLHNGSVFVVKEWTGPTDEEPEELENGED